MTNHEKQMAAIERQCKAANCGCVPEGWKLVPVEPTDDMIDKGCDEHCCEQGDSWYSAPALSYGDAKSVYSAMLAAAPAAPAAPTEGARDAEPFSMDGRDYDDAEPVRDAGAGTAVCWIDPHNYKAMLAQDLGCLRYLTREKNADDDIPLYAHPDPLLAEAVEALGNMVAMMDNVDFQSGVCCCGSDMSRHEDPMYCGHSPVDSGEYYGKQTVDAATAFLAKVRAAKEGK